MPRKPVRILAEALFLAGAGCVLAALWLCGPVPFLLALGLGMVGLAVALHRTP